MELSGVMSSVTHDAFIQCQPLAACWVLGMKRWGTYPVGIDSAHASLVPGCLGLGISSCSDRITPRMSVCKLPRLHLASSPSLRLAGEPWRYHSHIHPKRRCLVNGTSGWACRNLATFILFPEVEASGVCAHRVNTQGSMSGRSHFCYANNLVNHFWCTSPF